VREIVLTIGRLIGRPELIQLGALSARANDAALVVGENERLLSEVGWQQRFDLETGLCRTIDWWKNQTGTSI
jgi:nucleoside-diphosphate-sugar epimerase